MPISRRSLASANFSGFQAACVATILQSRCGREPRRSSIAWQLPVERGVGFKVLLSKTAASLTSAQCWVGAEFCFERIDGGTDVGGERGEWYEIAIGFVSAGHADS